MFSNFNQFDVIINLAGEPIFDRPWSAVQKTRLFESRVNLTQKLTALINASTTPPHCFISGSASGYYGDQGDCTINENTPANQGFTNNLCQHWEQAALQANTRVCLLRTGIVLSPNGGALNKMLPLFRLGLGGRLGSGKQFMPWIALEDMVNAIDFLLNNPTIATAKEIKRTEGAFNLSAPNPVHNAEFTQRLGKQLKRPTLFSTPKWLLKLILGERVCLVLDSQNMIPEKLLELGFGFEYEKLEDYFTTILSK